MSSEIAVRVSNLSKCYHIYDRPPDRLKQSTLPKLQRILRQPLRQYYREFWALKDISFEVKKGETIGIIGRNGSGKSTLLQIICGTLAPTSGSVETNGRVAALLELGAGFNPEFTGRENIFMNGAVLGLSREEIKSRFDSIAAFADIGDFIEQPAKIYSSGMVVRLAFAVAVNVNPQILVVDEVLAVGDELFQRKCFSRIEAIKNDGGTILFVSHSGATVVELCDQALLIDSGERLIMGLPKTIVGKYQKLIYAPEDRRVAIRDEIRLVHTGVSHAEVKDTRHAPVPTESTIQPIRQENLEEFFDPNLKPESTIVYESCGAFIQSPEILTSSGKRVNCLKRGQSYRYTYTVQFEDSATNVRFGMMIKTISGLELGGALSVSESAQSIPYLPRGAKVRVEFGFTCVLNPGTYFFNAGVVGTDGHTEAFLHRVLDACMFKVLPVANDTSGGFVDFGAVVVINILASEEYREHATP